MIETISFNILSVFVGILDFYYLIDSNVVYPSDTKHGVWKYLFFITKPFIVPVQNDIFFVFIFLHPVLVHLHQLVRNLSN